MASSPAAVGCSGALSFGPCTNDSALHSVCPENDGWTEVTDFSGLSDKMGRPQALMMNRGEEEMNLAVTRSAGTTTVVMVTVRK